MAVGIHRITEDFEFELCRYTGAPYAVAVDNQTNAVAICLMLWKSKFQELHFSQAATGKEFCGVIRIPANTYPSIPAEIVMAGFKLQFYPPAPDHMLEGEYKLVGTNIWDSALRFTADMYMKGQLQCLSFTGAYKHLKLGKGGAILCDSLEDYLWLKKARNSGRDECSYHVDTFTQLGRNCYMHPSVAALGIQLMQQFYNPDGTKKHNPDVRLPYPDLSDPKHTAFKT